MLSIRQIRSLAMFLALAVLLCACSSTSEESLWLDPPGWSRAQFLGVTERTSLVPMTLDVERNLYAGFFAGGEAPGLMIVKYGSGGEVIWRVLESRERFVDGRDLQLIWHDGSLQAFWIEYGDLLHAQIDHETGQVGELKILVEDLPVHDLSAACSANGNLTVAFGGTTDDPGIYILQTPDLGQPVLIDPEGVHPRILFDAYSSLHAAWAYEPAILQDAELRYTVYPDGDIQPGKRIHRFATLYRTTDVIEGPFLGVDLTHVYLGDTAMIRTGLREGEIETVYRAFPLWDPDESVVGVRLFMPMEFELRYEQPSPANGLQIGARVDWTDVDRNTDQIVEAVAASSSRSETAFAFHERVNTRSGQSQAQIGLITLEAGDPQGYQLISFTSTGSKQPNLLTSSEGYVYLSWLELTDVRTYSVYLSTTDPDLRAEFDAIGVEEWQNMLGDMGFGMFSGLVLFPVAFLWMIPPLIVIAALSFTRRQEERLTQPGHIMSLLLGLGVFQYVKFQVFPSMRTIIPFVQWIPIIPAGWYWPLQFAVPLVIGLISITFAVLSIRRRGQTSPTVLFLLYALLDGILTLAIYGGYLLGI